MRDRVNQGGLKKSFDDFLKALIEAYDDDRLKYVRRVTSRNDFVPHFGSSADLKIKILGPVTKKSSGKITYEWFENNAHTINGNSLVLRLEYGNRSLLLGGDLNIESENYLLSIYNPDTFKVDVAKACHHGSAEFTTQFLKAVKPFGTVISSGDNENYAHPGAQALGCAGKYTRGKKPLVFSTELARSYKSGKDIHYGNIQLRSDGDLLIMAQMYEKNRASDPWDMYVVL